MKKLMSIILCMIVAFSLSAHAGMTQAQARTLYPDAPYLLSEIDPNFYCFELVTEIETLAMYIMESNVSLAILNKNSGAIWSSVIPDSDLRTDGYLKEGDDYVPPKSGQYFLAGTGYGGVERQYYDASLDRFCSLLQFGYMYTETHSIVESTWYSKRELVNFL